MQRLVVALFALMSAPALAHDNSWSHAPGGGASWDGAYGGISVGGAISDGRALRGSYAGPLLTLDVENGLFPASIGNMHFDLNGAMSLGYSFRAGSFVGGIEGDVGYTGLKVHNTYSRVDPNPNPIFNGLDTNTSYQSEFGLLSTLRVRAGVADEHTLLYVTGGLAAGQVSNRLTLDLPGLGYSSPDWSESGTRYGYAIGVGLERKVHHNVGLKVEALYVDLADTVVNAVDPVAFPGESFDYRFTNDVFLMRAGLNYHF